MDKSTTTETETEMISMVDSWTGVFKQSLYMYSLCLQKAEKYHHNEERI